MNSNDTTQTTDERQELPQVNWDKLSFEEHVSQLQKLIKTDHPKQIRSLVEEAKSSFESLERLDKEQKQTEFEKEAEEGETFDYQNVFRPKFNQVLKDYRHRLKNYNLEVQAQQKKNTTEAKHIIQNLNGLSESSNKFGEKLRIFNEAKDKWAKLGDLEPDQRNTLRNNYKLQLDIFYSFLRQRNEYSELSFQKNQEEKQRLISLAKALLTEDNPSRSLKEFNQLYQMWRELGSAGKELNDALWEEFIEIKNQLNEKLKHHKQFMVKETEQNDVKRVEIIQLIENINIDSFTKHQHWVEMSENVNKLIELFGSLSSSLSSQNEELWARLKEARKQFNKAKNNFYRDLKSELQDNLDKKLALITEAKKHVESVDFKTATPLFKKLQKTWKTIGQVPRHKSDEIWNEFSTICNTYFDKLKQSSVKLKEQSEESIRQYSDIIASIQDIEFTKEKVNEQLTELWSRWSSVDKIHTSEIVKLLGTFERTMKEQVMHKTDLSADEYQSIAMEVELNQAKSDPRSLHKHLGSIRKDIEETEGEYHKLENNLGFFENPETNPLTQEIVKKIQELKQKVTTLNTKKNYINSLLRTLEREQQEEQ